MRTPSRRAFLRAGAGMLAGGVLAGCVEEALPRRFFVEADPSPSGLDATITAEATAPPTNDRPLLIEITFTSRADEPRAYAIRGTDFPFGEAVAVNSDPRTPVTPMATDRPPQRIVVAPRDGEERVEDCWRWTGRLPAEDDGEGGERRDRVTLSPGESITVERAALNHPENQECYPFGDYRFSEPYWTGADAKTMPEEEAIRWGFTLLINSVSDEDPSR